MSYMEQNPQPETALEAMGAAMLDVTHGGGNEMPLTNANFAQRINDTLQTEVRPLTEEAWQTVASTSIRFGAPRVSLATTRRDGSRSPHDGEYSPLSSGLLVAGNPDHIARRSHLGQSVLPLARVYLKEHASRLSNTPQGKNDPARSQLVALQKECNGEANPQASKVQRVAEMLQDLHDRRQYTSTVETWLGAEQASALRGQPGVETYAEARVHGRQGNRGIKSLIPASVHDIDEYALKGATLRAIKNPETELAVCAAPVFIDTEARQLTPTLNRASVPVSEPVAFGVGAGQSASQLTRRFEDTLWVPRIQAANAQAITELLNPASVTPVEHFGLSRKSG